jgi:hypothetical protein
LLRKRSEKPLLSSQRPSQRPGLVTALANRPVDLEYQKRANRDQGRLTA